MRVDLFDFELPEERIALRPAEPRDAARLLVVQAGRARCADHRCATCRSLLEPGDVLVLQRHPGHPGPAQGHPRARRGAWRMSMRRCTCAPRPTAGSPSCGRASASRSATASSSATSGKACLLGTLDATVDREGRGRRGAAAPSIFPAPRSTRRSHAVGHIPLPPYIASKRAGRRARPRATTRRSMPARRARSPRPPPACTSRRSCSQQLDAQGHRAPFRHAACRCRHLPAGQGRRYRRPQDACRDRPCLDGDGRRAERRQGAGRAHRLPSARRRCGCWKVPPREDGTIARLVAAPTDIFITPGYRFRAVDVLMTNFHLPRSTLFMLVSAFSGLETMRAAYAHAIDSGYRFYSYGDASLLFTERPMTERFHLQAARHRRQGAARRDHHAARHDPHAGLHAGRHRRHGQGDVPRPGARRSAPTSSSATPIT